MTNAFIFLWLSFCIWHLNVKAVVFLFRNHHTHIHIYISFCLLPLLDRSTLNTHTYTHKHLNMANCVFHMCLWVCITQAWFKMQYNLMYSDCFSQPNHNNKPPLKVFLDYNTYFTEHLHLTNSNVWPVLCLLFCLPSAFLSSLVYVLFWNHSYILFLHRHHFLTSFLALVWICHLLISCKNVHILMMTRHFGKSDN